MADAAILSLCHFISNFDKLFSHFSTIAPVESGPTSRFLSKPLSMRSILFSSLFGFIGGDVCIGGLLLLMEGDLFKLLKLADDGVGDVSDLDPKL